MINDQCGSGLFLGKVSLLAAILITPACVLGHNQALRERVEAVFRHHNEVANDLMLSMSWVEDDAGVDRLLQAEQAMNQACQSLDELVARRRDNKPVRLAQKRRVLAQLDRCEEETNKASVILKRL